MARIFSFNLPGIVCAACVAPIKYSLAKYTELKIVGVAEDIIDHRIAILVADDDETSDSEVIKKLTALITDLGIDAEYDNSLFKHLLKGLGGVLTGAVLMGLMMSGVTLPAYVMYLLMGASSAFTVYLGTESYLQAFKALFKTKTLSMDMLFTISTVAVLAVTAASFFVPGLPMMMDAGLMIFGFRHLGKALEESIKQKMSSGIKFRNRVPPAIEKVQEDGTIEAEKKALPSIQVDDVIIVRKGQIIPLDGMCLDESSSVYDTIISGNNLPTVVKQNERLLAGMRVADDVEMLKIKVTHPEELSYLATLDAKIEKANLEKAPIETKTTNILQYFIPGVLAVAAVSGIVISSLVSVTAAIQCAAAVLVSACPCTLGFITPLSIKIGLAKATENGITFKSGKALQSASQIDTVIFDLTGTLTQGMPQIVDFKVDINQRITPQEFFSYLALLEEHSHHPIARAIVNFVQDKKYSQSKIHLDAIDKSYHAGVSARIGEHNFVVGNAEMMKQKGINLALDQKSKQNASQVIYLARDGEILGYVTLSDPLRPGAQETIESLQKSGKSVHICTGADLVTANYYAHLLNIPAEQVYANCVGSDMKGRHSKTQYIDALKQQGKKVAMVGDAENDSLALSTAHLGISVQSADAMAHAQSDAVVDKVSLYPIFNGLTVARQTVQNIRENLIMSFTYNSAMMLVAGGLFVTMGFMLNPGVGVALMVVQTSLVLLNQYRLRRQSLPKPPVKEQEQTLDKQSTHRQFLQTNLLTPDVDPKTTITSSLYDPPAPPASIAPQNLALIPAPEVAYQSMQLGRSG